MDEIEKALLVAVNIDNQKFFLNSVEELRNLTYACNMDVLDVVVQNLETANNSTYIRKGKADEVKKQAKDMNADLVIFNNELSSSQLRNLQKVLDLPILDRTGLILQIFSKRAQTKEAQLQVEVAKLQYMLPRLVGLHSSLGRQGSGAGLSNKGSGEKKLELDRRRIEDKITELNKELKNIENERDVQRKQRKKTGIPLVSLAGYTNAGKSTLMNALVDTYKKDESKKVEEKNMLFATLDTAVRNITLPDKKEFLLSDTVGFISELPHNLVKAFRSTLEEIKQADLILEVVDFADENYKQHIEVTNQTLKELGADEIPLIYVYNKADLVLKELPKLEDRAIYMSASNKIGIEELVEIIKKNIFKAIIKTKFLIPYDKSDVVAHFNGNATINKVEYVEEGTMLFVECKLADYNKYKEFEKK
ncbi:MAG: GTPase HflX [Clostridia bacterium]|nr:GTPase HflX [Clostridia bacterium]